MNETRNLNLLSSHGFNFLIFFIIDYTTASSHKLGTHFIENEHFYSRQQGGMSLSTFD